MNGRHRNIYSRNLVKVWLTGVLRGVRHDCIPTRPLIVEEQTHGMFAHFGGELVSGLARDAPSCSGAGASGKPGATHFQPWENNSAFSIGVDLAVRRNVLSCGR
jgi:hypothetical protein